MKIKKKLLGLFALSFFCFTAFTMISCDENSSDSENISNEQTSSSIDESSMSDSLSGETHEHEWLEADKSTATCTEDGVITYICVDCGQSREFVYKKALGHNEVIDEAKEATCTKTGLTEGKHCDRCNEVLVQQEEIPSLGHSFADWTIVKEATCENTGIKRRDCINCDHYEEETIEAKGHNYESVVTNPTCIEQGYETFTCTNCNHSYVGNYVDALGHNTGELVAEIPATCTSKGTVAHYYCDVCNTYLDTNKNKIDSIDIPMKEHNVNASIYHSDATGHWNECNDCKERTNFKAHTPNINEPTETEDVVCTICDYVIEHALGHIHVMKYTEKVEATCEENGNIAYYQCNGCKKYYEDEEGLKEIKDIRELVISSLGHNYGELVLEVSATCTTDGKVSHYHCDRCDKYFNTEKEEIDNLVIKALGHNVTITESKEATCTTTGLTEGKHCDRCGEILEEQKIVAALGHNEVIDEKVDATCEETGLAQGSHCDRCNEVLVAQKVIPAKGHTEVTDKAVNATCTETGLTEGSHCSTCNKVLMEQEIIPALDHNYGTLIKETSATCTKTGIIAHYHCDRCTKDFDANKKEVVELTIPLKNHEFDNSNWTCDATGHWHKCKNCDEKDSFSAHTPNIDSATEYDDKVCTICDYVIQEALGHTHVMQYTEKVEATCETSGNIAYYQCKGCKKYYSDVNGNNEITDISKLTISALGHNYGKLVDKVEATCEEEGTKAHYHCDRCDRYFNNNKVEINDLSIPALGHTEVTDKAVNATCEGTGLTQGSHCSTCNKVLVEQDVIPALGHNEVIDAGKEATCTTTGLTEGKHCDRCNEVLMKQEVIPVLGHKEVIDKAVTPTCTENGLTEGKHCEVCKQVLVYQQVILATGHNEVIIKAVSPTCTETGLTEGKYCSKCNEVLVKQEVVDALGHDYKSKVTNPTCEEEGYTTHTCSRCDDSYVDAYAEALGHNYGDWEVTVEPGCESVGTKRRDCKECDHFEEEEIAALSHDVVVDKAVEPTCTETGLTEGSHCDRCKEVLVKQEIIDKISHNFDSGHCDCGLDISEIAIQAYDMSMRQDGSIMGYIIEVESGEKLYVIGSGEMRNYTLSTMLFDEYKNLTELYISPQITSIGDYFLYNSLCEIYTIEIPGSVERIGFGAFFQVYTYNLILNEGLVEIDDYAFQSAEISSLDLPDSLEKIGINSFDLCSNLRYLYIPKNVNYIEEGAFNFSGIREIIVDSNNSTYYSENNCIIERSTKILIVGCSESIIPSDGSVTAIGNSAFAGYHMRTISIPNTITSIGDFAFAGCTSLVQITIPNSVTYIGLNAFLLCDSLTINCNFANQPEGWNNKWNPENCPVIWQEVEEHILSDWIIEKQPTCKEEGYKYKQCSKCLEIIESEQIEKLEHSIVIIEAIEPTCTTIGWSEGSYCELCDEIIKEQEEIDALGHSYSDVWSFNSSYHWHSAICEHVELIDSYEAHELVDGNCEKCGYDISNIIYTSINEVKNSIDGTLVENVKGVITNINDKCIFIENEYGDAMLVYDSTNLVDANEGETILISGTKVTYNGHPEIKDLTAFSIIDDGDVIPMVTPIEVNLENVNEVWIIENNYKIFSLNCAKVVSIRSFGTSKVNIGGVDIELYQAHFPDTVEVGDYVNIICSMQAYNLNVRGCTTSESDIVEIIHNHTYISKTTESTCTSQGYTTHTCEVCGDSYVDSYAELINHNFVDGYCSMCNQQYYTDGLLIGIDQCDKYSYVYGFEGTEIDVIIPSTYNGYPVTNIDERAFEGCSSLTSITIPDSVTRIGDWAFYNCSSLTKVYYNGTIEDWCRITFSYESNPLCNGAHLYIDNQKVINIEIPESVTNIGNFAFSGCSSLESITIPESVTSIGNHAFEGCSSLESITIPDNLTSIGGGVFWGCSSLESITIPESVTNIGDFAFYNCDSLTSVTIPDSVKSIGSGAFYKCTSLTSITIPESVTSIGNHAFENCSSLTKVAFEEGSQLTSIGWEAFEGCSSLESITIPESVTSIGDYAFYKCTSLTVITIPESVTSIDDHTFDGCSSLTSITIPESVTSIGNHAFYGCSSLESITIPESVTSIGEYAFYNCTSLTSIEIPKSVTSIGGYAFYGCSSLTKVYYNGTIEDWCNITFDNSSSNPLCNGADLYIDNQKVTDIEILNGVTSIGDYAFKGCSSLTNITIPDNVTSIGDGAFWGCSSLTKVAFEEGSQLTSIGWEAFEGCSSLECITIPESVTSIGNYAFFGCSSLESITILDSVTSIGNYAFYGCSSLERIVVDSNNNKYDSRNNCNAIIETSTNTLIVGCKNTTIPESVTSIGGFAFSGCSSLESITIPDSVTSIDVAAFYECSSLESITIPDSVTSIGDSAFYRCSSLKTVLYSGTKAQWDLIAIDVENDYLTNATIHYNYEG